MLTDKKRVLHVAGRMVGGKVHLGEHMEVVFHLRTVGQHKAHARENVDNLILHDGQRVACAQFDRVGRAGKVDVVALSLGSSEVVAQRVDFVEGHLFQFVDTNAHSFLLVGSHVSEILHQCVNLTFLAQIFQSQSLNILGIRCREFADFFQQLFYFIKYHITFFQKKLVQR